MQEPPVPAGGNIVEVHIRAHKAAGASICGGFERDQVRVPHLLFGDVGGIVVATAVCRAVSGKVFCASEYMVRRADLWSLESQDLCSCDCGAQIGIFSCTFDHPSPAGIASNIKHGGKGPQDSDGAGFARSYG